MYLPLKFGRYSTLDIKEHVASQIMANTASVAATACFVFASDDLFYNITVDVSFLSFFSVCPFIDVCLVTAWRCYFHPSCLAIDWLRFRRNVSYVDWCFAFSITIKLWYQALSSSIQRRCYIPRTLSMSTCLTYYIVLKENFFRANGQYTNLADFLFS